VNRKVMDEFMATGAVVVGRRTFELADGWGGDHHDGVPIFVLSRHQPEAKMQWPAVTYLSDVKNAMRMAKDAAGEKDEPAAPADHPAEYASAGAGCRWL
jgi:dihydrofolate reductase